MAETKRTFLLTIANGQTASNVGSMGETGYRSPINVLIVAPTTLPETVNVQVAGPLLNFRILQSGTPATDIQINADRALPLTVLTASRMKLLATGPVSDERIFEVVWNVRGERG